MVIAKVAAITDCDFLTSIYTDTTNRCYPYSSQRVKQRKHRTGLCAFSGETSKLSIWVYNKSMDAVQEYMNQFEDEQKLRLEQLRQLVHAEAPEAQEGIMYGLVGYKLNKKPLVYFGGFEHHTGFYATPNGHEAFADEFSQYKQGKGSVQFPIDQPLPIGLIRQVILHRKDAVNGKS